MSDQLALIADNDTVLGFGSLGMVCCPVETVEEAQEALKKAAAEKFAILFLTDEAAEMMGEKLAGAMKKTLIMKIPSCRTRKKMGLDEITAVVEKAVRIANIMDKA